jgi:hypothetical protein
VPVSTIDDWTIERLRDWIERLDDEKKKTLQLGRHLGIIA